MHSSRSPRIRSAETTPLARREARAHSGSRGLSNTSYSPHVSRGSNSSTTTTTDDDERIEAQLRAILRSLDAASGGEDITPSASQTIPSRSAATKPLELEESCIVALRIYILFFFLLHLIWF